MSAPQKACKTTSQKHPVAKLLQLLASGTPSVFRPIAPAAAPKAQDTSLFKPIAYVVHKEKGTGNARGYVLLGPRVGLATHKKCVSDALATQLNLGDEWLGKSEHKKRLRGIEKK